MTQVNHGQMNNLTTLIKRLEAATSRLEDLTTVVPPHDPRASTGPSGPPPEPLPASIEEFDDIIDTELANYVKLSEDIGELVAKQSKSVAQCFQEQRQFLVITTKAKKPDTSSQLFMDLLAGMQEHMTKVSNICENNRPSPLIKHLSTVSEGAPALAWVTYEAKPASFVDAMIGAANFWGNRVLVDSKAKGDQKSIDWVNSYYNLLRTLESYVKKHYQNGIVWNSQGGDAREILDSLSASKPTPSPTPTPSAAGGAPPPPPPPPPPPGPPPVFTDDAPKPSGGADITDVFAELNRGSDVTAGLRKVDRSQMTHKNPEIRASSLVPARTPSSGSQRGKSPAPPHKSKPAHLTKKKPPKFELDGNKWIVENYENEAELVITETERNQSVFIFRCKNTTINIKGKVNTISVMECSKTNILADSLVSSVDIIKSTGFALQILHQIPTVLIDQCDGGVIYIPKESMNVEIFTTKTTALNICIPEAGDDGDYAERPVPEQLKHTLKDGLLVTEIVEHSG